MDRNDSILLRIKDLVKLQDPAATVILYGSNARGDQNKNSDIDILILIDKEKITQADQKKIKYPLYDLEFETGQIISPLVFSRSDWEGHHSITPLYENIKRDGIQL